MDISALIFHSLLHLNISSRASTIDTGAVLTFYKKKVIAWCQRYVMHIALFTTANQTKEPSRASRQHRWSRPRPWLGSAVDIIIRGAHWPLPAGTGMTAEMEHFQ